MMNGTVISQNDTLYAYDYDQRLLKQLEIVFLSIIFVMAVVGNSCVVAALVSRGKKLSRMNYFVMHLSLADIIVAFTNVLTQLVSNAADPNGVVYIHSDFLCRLYSYLQLLPLYASTYMLVIIACDRYQAICKPLSTYSWTRRRCYCMVVSVWILSIFMSIPQLLVFHYDEDNKRCNDIFRYDLKAFKIYVTAVLFAILVIPVAVLVVLYSCISYAVWKSVSLRNTPNDDRNDRKKPGKPGAIIPRTHSRRGYSRAKIRTVVMTSVIVIAFIICWTPYCVGNVVWAYAPEVESSSITVKILVLLSALNSCTNPWIYMLFNINRILKSLPCRKSSRLNNTPSLNYSSRTTQKSMATVPERTDLSLQMMEMTTRKLTKPSPVDE